MVGEQHEEKPGAWHAPQLSKQHGKAVMEILFQNDISSCFQQWAEQSLGQVRTAVWKGQQWSISSPWGWNQLYRVSEPWWLLPSKPPLEDPGESQSPEKVHYWTTEVCNTSAWITQLLITIFTAKPQKSSGQDTHPSTQSSTFRNCGVVTELILGRTVAGNQWMLRDGELNFFILLSE